MSKSLSYVNLRLDLHVVSTFWLGSGTSGTFSLHLFCPATIWTWETSLGKCSYFGAGNCTFSVKVSLMLHNLFLVPSLCGIEPYQPSLHSDQHKITCKTDYSLQGKNCFFWSYPRCFGLIGKFQHNIKISIKMARISRLSVSCDYCKTDVDELQCLHFCRMENYARVYW